MSDAIMNRFRIIRPMQVALLGLALASDLLLGGCTMAWRGFERDTLNPGLRSHASPRIVGLDFEQVAIQSGDRILDGYVVPHSAQCAGPSTALLIFHGRNETAPDWFPVQRLLHDHCVTSLVFDYSGHGHSTPAGTIANLNQDAQAAANFFAARFASSQRRCVLGFSMGAALALRSVGQEPTFGDCVILVEPFSSLKAMAERSGTPRILTAWFSDEWNNVHQAASVTLPLLWIHSKADETVPLELGQAVYLAKPGQKFAQVFDGFDHNAIHVIRPPQMWEPIIRFARDGMP